MIPRVYYGEETAGRSQSAMKGYVEQAYILDKIVKVNT